MLMSNTLKEWVTDPVDIKSTPVSAISIMLSKVTFPEASTSALLSINFTASFKVFMSILSNIIISAFASKASFNCSMLSTSTSIFLTKGEFFLARETAFFIPPAASM